ncbi:MAG: type II 3-dehydroquinate dehydratase [Elusimicrobia bacterium]|nr:type II 3-dehydroquinate dehydratase [Elusimicrobiota bacterium]
MNILVINGPNLDRLGKRDPSVYGSETLKQINEKIEKFARKIGVDVEFFQSSSEGEIVSEIGKADGVFDGIVINPAAYTHTSVAIRDAIEAVEIPVVEVHISNVYSREAFRSLSLTAGACRGQIAGFGADSYLLAIRAVSGKI